MKRLLLILILTFSFQSLTKADDIRDFEIEGMSLGDSLLDFFSKEEVDKARDESYADRLFVTKTIDAKDFKLYADYQFSFKSQDRNKTIKAIIGVIEYPDNIFKCLEDMKEIVSELSLLFPNAVKKDWGKYEMSNGHYFPVTFTFKDSSRAMAACFDWNKKSGINNNLKVSLYSAEYREYLKKQKQ